MRDNVHGHSHDHQAATGQANGREGDQGHVHDLGRERGHDHAHGGHGHAHDAHDHDYDQGAGVLGWLRHNLGHSHAAHERIDSVLESSARGIRALKISLLGLGATALFQVVIAVLSGSVGLLADTIHNFGDAATSIPLWVAFALARRGASRRYTYGYGRAEDLAGVVIVLVIFVSACVAAYESVMKLLRPQPVEHLWWVAAAALVGFLGNEAVAVFRIRVGTEIGSAALIADGQHSRVDGFTSLAVLLGVLGVRFGLPILDPLVGLGITVAILFIVKDAALAVWRRLLDGIEPEILREVEHAPLHVPGVLDVHEARARWLGHRVHADLHISVDPRLSVQQAHEIVDGVEAALTAHVRSFGSAQIHVCPRAEAAPAANAALAGQRGAP
jgi:cation diffusion facilitator family transporter